MHGGPGTIVGKLGDKLGRLMLLVLLGGIAATGCATSASPAGSAGAPSVPEDAREYYPLQTGWRWAYDVEKGGERILAVYAVIDRQGEVATLQAGNERIQYSVLPEGIARRAPSKESPTGDFLLRSPIRAGARWSIDGGTATVIEVNRSVVVPAGSFDNGVIIEENRTDPPRLVRTTYAPGVGPVSIEYQVHDPVSGRFETALRASLRGSTPPGADPLQ